MPGLPFVSDIRDEDRKAHGKGEETPQLTVTVDSSNCE